ncbi:hypothetical protein C8R43DRAFT_1229808 [Mycena crocata]|nr:hypothetical protein C8R43DRAFT_1229808 [Mycena crocata]
MALSSSIHPQAMELSSTPRFREYCWITQAMQDGSWKQVSAGQVPPEFGPFLVAIQELDTAAFPHESLDLDAIGRREALGLSAGPISGNKSKFSTGQGQIWATLLHFQVLDLILSWNGFPRNNHSNLFSSGSTALLSNSQAKHFVNSLTEWPEKLSELEKDINDDEKEVNIASETTVQSQASAESWVPLVALSQIKGGNRKTRTYKNLQAMVAALVYIVELGTPIAPVRRADFLYPIDPKSRVTERYPGLDASARSTLSDTTVEQLLRPLSYGLNFSPLVAFTSDKDLQSVHIDLETQWNIRRLLAARESEVALGYMEQGIYDMIRSACAAESVGLILKAEFTNVRKSMPLPLASDTKVFLDALTHFAKKPPRPSNTNRGEVSVPHHTVSYKQPLIKTNYAMAGGPLARALSVAPVANKLPTSSGMTLFTDLDLDSQADFASGLANVKTSVSSKHKSDSASSNITESFQDEAMPPISDEAVQAENSYAAQSNAITGPLPVSEFGQDVDMPPISEAAKAAENSNSGPGDKILTSLSGSKSPQDVAAPSIPDQPTDMGNAFKDGERVVNDNTEMNSSGAVVELLTEPASSPPTLEGLRRSSRMHTAPAQSSTVAAKSESSGKKSGTSLSKKRKIERVVPDEDSDAASTSVESVDSNGLVYLFNSVSSLSQSTSERETVQALLEKGQKVVDEPRPKGQQTVEFTVYCPSPRAGDPPIKREYNYPVFDNAPFDYETLTEMLHSEVVCTDGFPLHCQASARNLNPGLKPSSAQSLVAVCTEHEWTMLSAADQQELQSNRCVLILESGTVPPVPFTQETLENFRDLNTKIELQDCGLRTSESEDVIRVGTLTDMLNETTLRGKPIFNSLQNPQTYQQIPLPPGWSNLATHERACAQTTDLPDCPMPHMSWEDLRWVIIGNLHAKSPSHQDILSTIIEIICGWKIWMVATRLPLPNGDLRGDFRTRFAFNDYISSASNWGFLRWEFILLGPNMHFIQTADTIHSVISIEDCIAWGLHFHCAMSISRGLSCSLHNVFTARSTTNADHVTARTLFVRIFLFQAKNIVRGTKPLHVLDVTEKNQLFDLMYLMAFVVLYTAFDTTCYLYMEGGQLPMHEDRFQELMSAWGFVVDVLNKLEDHAVISDASFPTFKSLFEAAVVHMASCAVRYRDDWEDAVHEDGFTLEALTQQLGLALAAFDAFRKNKQIQDFDSSHAKRSVLRKLFHAGLLKKENSFVSFLPWTPDTFPCTLRQGPE